MKRLTALLLALFLTAAIAPATSAGSVSADDMSVTYTVTADSAVGLGVGGSFYVYIGVSEGSALWSGHWLLDYPEDIVTPTAANTTFTGSLTSLIEETWDDDTAYSDKPAFITNMAYEGGSGSVPHGEPGNMYSMTGMYLDTFRYGGLQMGGNFVRFKYRIDRIPTVSEALHDDGGYYIEFPLLVVESNYLVPGTTQTYVPHEHITAVSGKVYITPRPSEGHTVSFYGFGGEALGSQQVTDGDPATAPSVPAFVETAAGTYAFYRWSEDFSHVTHDMQIYAEYLLLGDVDMNGQVNSSDALLTLRAASGLHVLNNSQAFAADVSGDGALSSLDALKLARYVLGIIDSLAY